MADSKSRFNDCSAGELMVNRSAVICPQCCVAMNHHSDKILYVTDLQEGAQADPALGGIIAEFHTCPKCGGAASRPA